MKGNGEPHGIGRIGKGGQFYQIKIYLLRSLLGPSELWNMEKIVRRLTRDQCVQITTIHADGSV